MGNVMQHFIIHPRVEASMQFKPSWLLVSEPPYLEARRTTGAEWPGSRPSSVRIRTVLNFLLEYDFRGMNRFQEQENLEFLRLYMQRYPEIRAHFRGDILEPTHWEE